MNAVTIPIGSAQEPDKKSTRKAWKPGAKDELIYRWVKFEGKRQTWVASALGISQPTVSRVIERYEKWQAHVEPGDSGRMTPEERRRAQRWATYERNEVIMQSALRIAHDLEGSTEISKIRTWRKDGEMEKNITQEMIDRSGTCCRFLRLAFRVNMEQLKLAELEPLEQLEPAEVEEIEEIDREEEMERGGERESAADQITNDQAPMTNDEQPQLTDNGPLSGSVNKVNKVNNANGAAADVTVGEDDGCDANGQETKKSATVFTRSRTRSKDASMVTQRAARSRSQRARWGPDAGASNGQNRRPETASCVAETAALH